MRGWAALILLWLWSAACAQAQVITLTSGEHAGFTRLVLQSSERFTWRAQIDARGANLRLPAQARLQGLERVFTRIPRTRLAALQAEGGTLRLDLGCDCALSIWEERAGLVVIDILPSGSNAPPGPTLAEAAGSALARERRLEIPTETPDPPMALAPMLLEALAREVAVAQSSGILQPASPAPSSPQRIVPLAATVTGPDVPSHMRVTTALDRPAFEALTLEPAPQPDLCNGSAALEFLGEAPPGPFAVAQATLLGEAYGEFDLPNRAAIADLTRLYLHHAMGAEARALIDLFPPPDPEGTLMRAVADILENRPSNALPRFARSAECSDIQLALALAAGLPGLDPDAQSGARAALGFALLSAPVRLAIGPQLAERLLAAGFGDAGNSVITAIRHEPDLPAATLARLEAQANARQGRAGQAIEHLETAPGMDAMSLRLQLELLRDRGEVPGAALLDMAEALAASLRQEPPGMDLLFLSAELRAMGGDLNGALDTIARAWIWSRERPALIPQTTMAEARVWSLIARTPSDTAFLETALSHEAWRSPDMAVAVTAAVASRLAQFGLAPAPTDPLSEAPLPETSVAGDDTALDSETPRAAATEAELVAPPPLRPADPVGVPATMIETEFATPAPASDDAMAPPSESPQPEGARLAAPSPASPAVAPARTETATIAAPSPPPASAAVVDPSVAIGVLTPIEAVPSVAGPGAPGTNGAIATAANAPVGVDAPSLAEPAPAPDARAQSPAASEAGLQAPTAAPPPLAPGRTPVIAGVNPMQQAASLLESGEALRAAAAGQLGRAP